MGWAPPRTRSFLTPRARLRLEESGSPRGMVERKNFACVSHVLVTPTRVSNSVVSPVTQVTPAYSCTVVWWPVCMPPEPDQLLCLILFFKHGLFCCWGTRGEATPVLLR